MVNTVGGLVCMPKLSPISYKLVNKHNQARINKGDYAVFFTSKNSLCLGVISIVSAASRRSVSRLSIIQRASLAAASCSIQASSSLRSAFDKFAEWFRETSSKSCNDLREASSKKSIGGRGMGCLPRNAINFILHPISLPVLSLATLRSNKVIAASVNFGSSMSTVR